MGRPWERKFPIFCISADSPPLREIAPKAVERFKHQVRQITRRARGVSIDRVVKDLRPYLRGRSEYFGCETPWLFRDLDKWVRHRLRCYLWVQWRTPRRRRARLGVLGVKPRLAAYISWSRGPWRPSGSKTLNFAIRNACFDDLGSLAFMLGVLNPPNRRIRSVRTVVWEGRRRETPPYPDLSCALREGSSRLKRFM